MRVTILLAGACLSLGCTKSSPATSSEGEPCNVDDGDRDCDDAMVCEATPDPRATNAAYVCCPLPGGATTAPACTVGSPDAGNPAPPDGSTD